MASQTFQLLVDGLSLRLTVGRYPQINCTLHISPPLLLEFETKAVGVNPVCSVGSIPTDVGRHDPSASVHRWSLETDDELSTVASFAPPRCRSSRGYSQESAVLQGRARGRRAYLNFCRITRIRQNLSFVISPLNRIIARYRTVKKRTWLAKGYGSFTTAWRTLQGIEAVEMIRKGRARWVAKGDAIAGRLHRRPIRHRRLTPPNHSLSPVRMSNPVLAMKPAGRMATAHSANKVSICKLAVFRTPATG